MLRAFWDLKTSEVFKPRLVQFFFGTLEQRLGGQLGDIDQGLPIFAAADNSRFWQIVADIDDASFFFPGGQKVFGVFGPGGCVQVKKSDDVPLQNDNVAAQVEIHTARLPMRLEMHRPKPAKIHTNYSTKNLSSARFSLL